MDTRIDKHGMREILLNFPKQCREGFNIQIPLPGKKNFKKICMCGMGGSAIGGDILKIFVERDSQVVFNIHRDYNLPSYIDKESLVIAVSYSGNTEETVSAYKMAKKTGCKIWVLTSNGKLYKFAKKDKIPAVQIPSGLPPRCALGYLFFPCFNLLRKLGIIKEPVTPGIFEKFEKYVLSFSKNNSLAYTLAEKILNRVPIIYSGNLYYPAILRWKTQIAENSKNFAFINVIPEMNHNEIMSWHFPEWFIEKTIPIYIKSSDYNSRIRKRFEVTEKIISSFQKEKIIINPKGKSLLEKIFYLIILGDWVSYYLALLNKVDPTEIREIDLLKESLKRKGK